MNPQEHLNDALLKAEAISVLSEEALASRPKSTTKYASGDGLGKLMDSLVAINAVDADKVEETMKKFASEPDAVVNAATQLADNLGKVRTRLNEVEAQRKSASVNEESYTLADKGDWKTRKSSSAQAKDEEADARNEFGQYSELM